MQGDDLDAWNAVAQELRAILRGLRDHKDGPNAAPIHHRLAVMRLTRGVYEELDAVQETLGEQYAEVEPDELVQNLIAHLDNRAHSVPVLGALRPGVRAEAMLQLHEALQADPEFVPGLRAATALATVSGRWAEAVAWLERIAGVEPGEKGALPLMTLGDIHWKKLGQTDAARGFYQAAQARSGDDPVLLDKLLKLDLDLSNWSDAVQTCHALIDQVTGEPEGKPLRVTYLLTLGEIHVYGLQRPAQALMHYLDALDSMPDYALTYTLLRELLESNRWAELREALGDRAEGTPLARYAELFDAGAKAHPDDAGAIVSHVRDAVLNL
jgi:tetratricopeptide (TPR) repeat protein